MDELLDKREGTILTLHVDMIAKFQKNRELYDLGSRFDVVTCDSQILYFASKLLRTPFKERVSGSDYFPKFYERYAERPGITIFLCGAEGDIAQRAMDKINAKVGREMIVGGYGPPLGYENDPAGDGADPEDDQRVGGHGARRRAGRAQAGTVHLRSA